MDIERKLHDLLAGYTSGDLKEHEKRPAIKRVPLTEEQKTSYLAMRAKADELLAGLQKMKHLHRKLWVDIEEMTEVYSDMRINDKTWMVEVLGTMEEDDEDED